VDQETLVHVSTCWSSRGLFHLCETLLNAVSNHEHTAHL